ncbi:FliH/SctL family protein [Frigoribacterium sp. PhB24]|uniref:FliH/SctL family protein n=1 Tax=Frigoribacterium sp. PhB24 TaxID=2485204 RepID=UPI0011CE8135|nr:FliH/SctL family protein [Frigoribacterium sp. PhB24]
MMTPEGAAPAFARVSYPSVTLPGSDAAATRQAHDARAEARGHAAGYASGLRAAELELAARRAVLEAEHSDLLHRLQSATVSAVEALAASARALDARVAPVLDDAEEALVTTAFELAEAVLGYELRASESLGDESSVVDGTDPRAGRTARAAVARALAVTDPGDVVTVRLHPADLAQLDDVTRDSVAADVAFVADATLARGDSQAELRVGQVDARLGTALDRARTALLGDAAVDGGVS